MTAEFRRSLVLSLVRAGRVPAHLLAERTGASVRTIYRDIQHLIRRGYAIGAVGGRRGGFWLEAHSLPVPLTLSAAPQALVDRLLNAFPELRAQRLRAALGPLDLRPSAGCPASLLEAFEIGAHERRILHVITRGRPRRRLKVLEPERLLLYRGRWAVSGLEKNNEVRHIVDVDRITGGRVCRTRVRNRFSRPREPRRPPP